MRGRRSARQGARSRRRVSAVGLLPSLFLVGISIAAPFAGTTTATVANKHAAFTPAAANEVVYVDPTATSYLVQIYLAIAALAAVIMLFAIVWTDALTTTARTGRLPVLAPRASRPRSWPTASAQRG